jgi:RHS repeat-associated protein
MFSRTSPSDVQQEASMDGARAGSAPAHNSTLPSLSLPTGGGAIRNIGEKFAANPVMGSGALAIPLATSPGRAGFGPQFSLTYDSNAGNGPFGSGWSLNLPAVTRKTEKGLPQYVDGEESDTFVLSGAEDLVPLLIEHNGQWTRDLTTSTLYGQQYSVQRYRPRTEGLFARIERWTNQQNPQDTFWRTISPENVTGWYGKTAESRIADPQDLSCVFSWMLCETYDDKGNVSIYRYKAENTDGVDLSQANERNRSSLTRSANRYLKRVLYGNTTPYFPDLTASQPVVLPAEWHFELVFDYGEHDPLAPVPQEGSQIWQCRADPFSTYRATFEVRTYRLCQRALMFHHFASEPGVGLDCLVRSTDFTYAQPLADPTQPFYSFLLSAMQTGYIRNPGAGYIASRLPPLVLTYSAAVIDETVREIDSASLQNLPYGLGDLRYQWVDLDGEGLPGILTEQGGSWFYKPNLSPANRQVINGVPSTPAQFGALEVVARQPSLAALNSGRQALLDFTGDGRHALVALDSPTPGFFERTADENWTAFQTFSSLPVLDWQNPEMRLVDLSGNGLADILLGEDETFSWYASLGATGFGPAQSVPQALDEERGPRLVFADSTSSIFLADLSGDGLSDLVRMRNGEVCYWPNLGYGRFGTKVSMDHAPWFEASDTFDGRRLRLADIDGSGTTDIVYFASEGVQVTFNQSGNSWSAPHTLRTFPPVESVSSASVLDLLGNGTACLTWSSPLATHQDAPMRYIDLMGGQKPHLLIQIENNMGATTSIQYTPSTRFYVADKLAGTPWVTRIPFPVHVVEQVEHHDHISRSRFVTRYTYHHGYYDGCEREFRGFGRVDQWDSESFEDYVLGVTQSNGTQTLAPELFQPPVTTTTWFHTGALLEPEMVLHYLQTEYYTHTHSLPEPPFPGGLDDEEWRECARALKGLPLRQEVYSFDGSLQAQVPYSVTEYSYTVQLVQKRAQEKHASFLPCGRETVVHSLERNPTDPRIAHSLTLETDQYGHALKTASVVYGRQVADPKLPGEVTDQQQKLWVSYAEVDLTLDLDQGSPTTAYRLRVPHAQRTYEITGITPASGLFLLDELKNLIAGAADIAYEVVASGANPQKRLLSASQSLFLDNTLNPLPPGQWDTLGLPYQSYQQAFTPGVVSTYYGGQVADSDFATAGYVHFNGDASWWIPSGTAVFPANPATHFYLPTGTRDPLDLETSVTFDAYDLLLTRIQVKQADWTVVSASNDYRVLGPVLVTDANQNRAAVEIDALGMVVKSALMGKAGANEGDTLADPTTRLEYNLFNWMINQQPNYAHTFTREQHGAANPRWQESYAYSNGSGSVALVKSQAHPGPALQVNPDGSTTLVNADPRWIGNGRTILTNKGNPVKQYEPYFSTTFAYEDEKALSEIGATPILYYDAIGRHTRTAFPNGTLSRVEFDPWLQRVFDANDTVKESQWYVDRSSPDPSSQPEPGDPEQRAAWLAAKHANTPVVRCFDSLGRPVYAIFDYGGGTTAAVRSVSDLTGRNVLIYDQLQRVVASGFMSMAGARISGLSAEKGQRWTFFNVLGALVKAWDEHGRVFRTEYDQLHRPLSTFAQQTGQPDILFSYIVYGDRHPNALQLNLLGIAHQIYDSSGLVQVPGVDLQGNPTSVQRVLAQDYQHSPDWSNLAAQPDYPSIQTAASALLIGEVFTASATYDALRRPMHVTLPDNTVIIPTYNEANFLALLQVQIQGQGALIPFLQSQDYNARGQRLFAHYGNDVFTSYLYDPKTFRLTNLLTSHSGSDPATQSLQNLTYSYDPAGNVTQLDDTAQQTYYFNNAVVSPTCLYEYDALYQLVQASGREHAGQANDALLSASDLAFVPQLPENNDLAAVRTYTETYTYDLLGNITALKHAFKPQPGIGNGWTRAYHYAYQDDPANTTNRLLSTSAPGDPPAGPYSATYTYDDYGNMSSLPSFSGLTWNFMDQLQQVHLGGGGTAFYVYEAGGRRVRKVIERQGGLRVERIYLGAVEIYRESQGANAPNLERYTLHIADDSGSIAQVDSKTKDTNNSDPANPLHTPLIRYRYSNHIGSALLETDASGVVISYEQYHPYGTSAYRSSKSGVDLSLKRYRFSGKERDEETGLYSMGARYYAAWLGRWTSSDPAGFADGLNLYTYCRNNPIMLNDPQGTQPTTTEKPEFRWPLYDMETGTEIGYIGGPNGTPYYYPKASAASGSHSSGHKSSKPPATHRAPPRPKPPDPPPDTGGAKPHDDAAATAGAAGGAAGTGAQAVTQNPPGPTLEVPDNFDDEKLSAYKDRITSDRGVGIRPRPPGGGSRTDDIRAANEGARDAYEAGLPGGQRPPGTDIDHTVELQHILRGNATAGSDVVRPQDYRPLNSRVNSSQGSSAMWTDRRAIAAGAPENVPAGGVARTAKIGAFYNRPAFRTAMRGAGYASMVAGPALTTYASSQVPYAPVRYTGYTAAAVEAGGVGYYTYGRFALGGASGVDAGLAAMTLGGRIAMGAGGVAQAVISGYMAVEEYRQGDYRAAAFDTAAAIGGVALIAAAIVTAPALATALVVVGIATGIAAGVYHLGRAFNWWS